VDPSGNVYATGTTERASGIATPGAAQTTFGGWSDAFVMKLSASGAVSYVTYVGGEGLDVANAIAVDRFGNAFITGYTVSSRFPTRDPLPGQGALHAGSGMDAFVVEVNPTGSQFLFSTYLGGSANGPGENGSTKSHGNAIALDAAGNVYLTGYTLAADFPTVNAFQPVKGTGINVFVTEIKADHSAIVYSTFLGGTGISNDLNIGNGIAVDRLGNILVAGDTDGVNFPLKNAFQTKLNGTGLPANDDAFVAKLNPHLAGAAQLVYSTYIGGGAIDYATCIAVDDAGNAYVTGHANSDTIMGHFPLVRPFQSRFVAGAFVAGLSPTGAMLFNSYYGGGGEVGEGIAVDGFGNVVFVGNTDSARLPTTANAFEPSFPGGSDSGFVAVLAGGNRTFTGTDRDGDLYTVQLTGPGALSVVQDDNGSGRGPIRAIYLTGTSPAASVLTILVTRAGGDGLVNVGTITGSGLLSIVAGSCDLVGRGIDLSGALVSLTIHDVGGGASVLAAGLPTQFTSIQAHVIGDGATIAVGSGLSVLRAARVGAATITAPQIVTLIVSGDKALGIRGDLAAHLVLTGGGTALGTAAVAGAVVGANIEVRAGSVTAFTAGAFLNSTLFLGQGGKLTTGARLGTFTMTGLSGSAAFVNSNVAAWAIGGVSLSSVQTSNGGVAFGIQAHLSIASVVVTSPRFVYDPRLKTPQGVGDFTVTLV
jgi:hypothetical protein